MISLNPLNWLKGSSAGQSRTTSEIAREMLSQAFPEAFKLARRDRPNENHQPFAYSGDSAIRGSHELMNRRVRDLVRNTSHGKRIKTAFQNLIVGEGFQTFSWPFASHEMAEMIRELEMIHDGQFGPRLQFALESDDLFQEWSDSQESFDLEGRLTRMEMERMAMGEACTTGNALIIRNFRKNNPIVPLCYQIIEREQLDESMDRPASQGKNKIVGGIEFDYNNRAVAYYIYNEHPHDAFSGSASGLQGLGGVTPQSLGQKQVRISADRVIDLCLWDRPSSSLGVSWYDATGQTTWDRDSCVDSEIKSAAIDASLAFAAYLQDADKYGGWGFSDGDEDNDGFGNRQFKLGQSPVAAIMDTNERLEIVRSTRPNKDMPIFMKMLDHDEAAGHSLSYTTVTGNYKDSNFTSTRGEKLDEELHVKPLQRWFGLRVSLRIRKEFNAIAAATGQFQSVTPSQFRKDQRIYQRFDAFGPGRDFLDPFKEGEARTGRLRTGMASKKEECARINKHWIRLEIQRAIEKRFSQSIGVESDYTKSGSGNSSNGSNSQNFDQAIQDFMMLNEES